MQRLRGRSMHGESLAVNDRRGHGRGDLKGTGLAGDRGLGWKTGGQTGWQRTQAIGSERLSFEYDSTAISWLCDLG